MFGQIAVTPEIAITAHRFTMPETALHHAALNALAVTLSDNFNVGQFLEFNYGGELQSLAEPLSKSPYPGSDRLFRAIIQIQQKARVGQGTFR